MTGNRWREVDELLQWVLELDPPERAEFLARRCGLDQQLRLEVESLLAAHDGAGSFLETRTAAQRAGLAVAIEAVAPTIEGTMPPAPGSDAAADEAQDRFGFGSTLGRYLLLDRLGKGGMGVVYTAYDPELDRKIAIKLVQPGQVKE